LVFTWKSALLSSSFPSTSGNSDTTLQTTKRMILGSLAVEFCCI
jgi:hypothetical protein